MRYWLLKSEPDEFSIDDLAAAKGRTTPWFGVRNYQARNFIVLVGPSFQDGSGSPARTGDKEKGQSYENRRDRESGHGRDVRVG